MILKKLYWFLFMPYLPLLRLNFSYKVLFFPELILGAIATLFLLILNELFSFGFSFSLKLMLFLILQAFFSLVFQGVKPIEKNNKSIVAENPYNSKIALYSLLLTIGVIILLVFILMYIKGASILPAGPGSSD